VGTIMALRALTHTIVNIWGLILEILIVLAIVACFVAFHAFLQRRLRVDVLRRQNDVAGYLFSAVGVLYAVVLGFVVVVVWQKYDGTVSTVEGEVNATSDLYRVVDSYPAAARAEIRSGLRDYVDTVITVEWPAMERNADVPMTGGNLLERVGYNVDRVTPANWGQLAAQQAAIADMERLLDARRQRLVQTVPVVPGVLWFALITGALAMIAFCFIFGVENRPAQLAMTAILVGFIGILFIVIYEFAGPFSGSVYISDDGWLFLQQRLPYIL
jgi:Protein of unknown function (DUF4239)